jgi:hypothetical protein
VPVDVRQLPVAVIARGGAHGTAFRVAPGVWVTCKHVLPEATGDCHLAGVPRSIHRIERGGGDGGDWCVVQLTRPELDPTAATLAFADGYRNGDQVWRVGFPRADARNGPAVIDGVLKEPLPGKEFAHVDSPGNVARPGMSGGPVIRRAEVGGVEVVGINQGHVDIETTWFFLFGSTRTVTTVVVDPALRQAVARMVANHEDE